MSRVFAIVWPILLLACGGGTSSESRGEAGIDSGPRVDDGAPMDAARRDGEAVSPDAAGLRDGGECSTAEGGEPCFPCGDDIRCVDHEEYCFHRFDDMPDTFSCEEYPEECHGDATCSCLDRYGPSHDRCIDDAEGQVTVELDAHSTL